MKSRLYILPLSIILLMPVSIIAQSKHDVRADSLKVKAFSDSLLQSKSNRENTFKLLPKFHSDKDSAGFQLIPPHVDSYNIIMEQGQNDSTKARAPADSAKQHHKK